MEGRAGRRAILFSRSQLPTRWVRGGTTSRQERAPLTSPYISHHLRAERTVLLPGPRPCVPLPPSPRPPFSPRSAGQLPDRPPPRLPGRSQLVAFPSPWPSLQTFPVVGGTSGAPQVLVTNWLRPRPHEPAVALSDQLVVALVRGGRGGRDGVPLNHVPTADRPTGPPATAGRPFPHALTNWSCHRHRAYHQVPRP